MCSPLQTLQSHVGQGWKGTLRAWSKVFAAESREPHPGAAVAAHDVISMRFSSFLDLPFNDKNKKMTRSDESLRDRHFPFITSFPLSFHHPASFDAIVGKDTWRSLVYLKSTNSVPEIDFRVCPKNCPTILRHYSSMRASGFHSMQGEILQHASQVSRRWTCRSL